VLSYLGVERAHVTARTLHGMKSEPWTILEAGFADPSTWPAELMGLVSDSVGLEWRHTDPDERVVVRLLSTLNVRTNQVRMLMAGDTPLPLVSPTLARTLRSTNRIESMISIARNHSTNVKNWQNGNMALRWCAAGMLEAGKQFRRVNGHLHLPALRIALDEYVAAQTVSAVSHDEPVIAA